MCPGLKEGGATPRNHPTETYSTPASRPRRVSYGDGRGGGQTLRPTADGKRRDTGGTANGRLCRCTVEQMKLICDSFNTENFMSLMGKAMLAEQKVERWLLAPHRTPLGSRRSNTLQHPTAGSPALYRVSYNRCCDPETHRRRRRQRSHQNAPETPLVLFCAWEVFCITFPYATSPLTCVQHKVLRPRDPPPSQKAT